MWFLIKFLTVALLFTTSGLFFSPPVQADLTTLNCSELSEEVGVFQSISLQEELREYRKKLRKFRARGMQGRVERVARKARKIKQLLRACEAGTLSDRGSNERFRITGPNIIDLSTLQPDPTGQYLITLSGEGFVRDMFLFGVIGENTFTIPIIFQNSETIQFRANNRVEAIAVFTALKIINGNFVATNSLEVQFLFYGGGSTPTPSPTPAGLRWSDPNSWPNSQVPASGEDVTIPQGSTYILDGATASIGRLTISGLLKADPSRNIAINAKSIMIRNGGALEIGTVEHPYTRRAVITLTGERGLHTARTEDNALNNDGMSRGLMLMNGGRLELIGAPPAITKTKLNDHATPGQTQFTLAEPVDWKAGDRIVISTTDFYGVSETESFIVAEDTNGLPMVRTTSPLQAFRFGRVQYPRNAVVNRTAMSYSQEPFTPLDENTPRVLDQRAKVANLTRNIVIRGADDSYWRDQGFGAHVMVMGLSSIARLLGVEFTLVGQRQALGRYPFHWHMLSYQGGEHIGDVDPANHFLVDSSIHESENRMAIIHGTNGVLLEGNVGYNIRGHGVFLEDGVERRNTIRDNLVMKVRNPRPGQHLKNHESDGSSGFWITNLDNVIENNSASDCHGIGVWNTLAERAFGESRDVQIQPNRIGVLSWRDNEGHGNGNVGVATDLSVVDEAGNMGVTIYFGAPGGFSLVGITTWKNRNAGYVNRIAGGEGVAYERPIAADNNGVDFTGAVTLEARLTSGLFVGESLNNFTPFTRPRHALASYHFALRFAGTFINYPWYNPQTEWLGAPVVGGGVMSTADLYPYGVAPGMLRMQMRLINSNAGYITPSPAFDGLPVLNPDPNRGHRFWSLAGAIWDPHGFWGPAGNYVVPDVPFYTHGLPVGTVPIMNADRNGVLHQNGWSTPHLFYGLEYILQSFGQGWGSSNRAIRYERLNPATMQVVAEHYIGPGNQSMFFPGFRNAAVPKGSVIRVTNPGEPLPREYSRAILTNIYRQDDDLLLALPFDGTVPVDARIDSGYMDFVNYNPAAVKFLSPGPNLDAVRNDATGQTFWQDTQSNLVWFRLTDMDLPINIWNWQNRLEEDEVLLQPRELRIWAD